MTTLGGKGEDSLEGSGEDAVLFSPTQLIQYSLRYHLNRIPHARTIFEVFEADERLLFSSVDYLPHRLLPYPGQQLQGVHARGDRLGIVEESHEPLLLVCDQLFQYREDFGFGVGCEVIEADSSDNSIDLLPTILANVNALVKVNLRPSTNLRFEQSEVSLTHNLDGWKG